MADWTHRHARINGIHTHWVEQGEGMPVIMCHGFPHLWFSWRHQIPVIAELGFKAVALDMRGMGQTDAPADYHEYGVKQINGDLLGILDHLGADKAIFMGLDFGVFACYDLAHTHPDRMAAVIGLENPAAPHNPAVPPLTEYAEMAKKHFLHIEYFRPYGPADTALAAECRRFMTNVFFALSGEYHLLDMFKHPPGTTYLQALPTALPFPWKWMNELEMEFYVSEYARSGFTGGLNWYRSMDVRWHDRKAFEGHVSKVPAFFIGSEKDVDLEGFHGDDPLQLFRNQFSDVREMAMVPEAGHMLQMERPEDVNRLLRKWLPTLK